MNPQLCDGTPIVAWCRANLDRLEKHGSLWGPSGRVSMRCDYCAALAGEGG